MNNVFSRLFWVALICAPVFGAPVKTVLEVSTSGGLTPKPVPAYGVRILSNGAVQEYSGNKTTEIARLTKQTIEKVQKIVQAVEGELVDLQAGKPYCSDAPTTVYTAVKKNGTKVPFAKLAACHEFEIKSAKGVNVPALKRTLNGLTSLASLRAPKAVFEADVLDLE